MSTLPHLSPWCQRWTSHQHTWLPRSEGGFDRACYTVAPVDEQTARAFTLAHHYSSAWPSAKLRYGLWDNHTAALCGVLVLGIPMHPAVLTGPLPGLEPYQESLELSRLVLLDAVPSNAESWFCAQAFAHAAGEGVRGVVAFSDPLPRTRDTLAGPIQITPGHVGTVYQALSARYTGRATPRSLILLPDATTLTARAAAKVTAAERGSRGVIARLTALGAPTPRPGQHPAAWLATALETIGAQRLRHPGNHRYVFTIGSPGHRRRVVIALAAQRYPKRHALAGAR